jgi:hypothetical protein
MNNEPSGSIVPKGTGLFEGLGFRIKLILRLMKDRRVHPLVKLLPIGAVVYLFVPDLAPGPLDDAAVVWLGSYLFVELCPPEVVEEHVREMTSIIEGEFRPVDDDPSEPGSSS